MTGEQHRRAQGVHGVGSGTFNDDQYARVVAAFKEMIRTGSNHPVTALDLHVRTKVPGLTVRQIMSAADGVDFLLGGTGAGGYSCAEDPDDSDRLTARFQSQVDKMTDRINRRRAYWVRLAAKESAV